MEYREYMEYRKHREYMEYREYRNYREYREYRLHKDKGVVSNKSPSIFIITCFLLQSYQKSKTMIKSGLNFHGLWDTL